MEITLDRLKQLGKEELKKLDDEIEKMKSQEKYHYQDTSLVDINEEIRNKKKSLQDLSFILSESNKELSQKQRQLSQLNNQISSVKSQHRDIVNKSNTAEEKVKEVEATKKKIETDISSITEKISIREKDMLFLKEQIQSKKEELERLEREYSQGPASYNTTYKNYLEELEFINKRIEDIRRDYENSYMEKFSSFQSKLTLNLEMITMESMYHNIIKPKLLEAVKTLDMINFETYFSGYLNTIEGGASSSTETDSLGRYAHRICAPSGYGEFQKCSNFGIRTSTEFLKHRKEEIREKYEKMINYENKNGYCYTSREKNKQFHNIVCEEKWDQRNHCRCGFHTNFFQCPSSIPLLNTGDHKQQKKNREGFVEGIRSWIRRHFKKFLAIELYDEESQKFFSFPQSNSYEKIIELFSDFIKFDDHYPLKFVFFINSVFLGGFHTQFYDKMFIEYTY